MKYLIIAFIIFFSTRCIAQFKSKAKWEIGFGPALSIGKNTTKELKTENSLTIVHPVNYRYKYPSLRIRGGYLYHISKFYSVGLISGINVRYVEYYHYVNYKTTFSVPISLNAKYEHKGAGTTGFVASISGGVNLMKVDVLPWTDRGGFICSGEIGIHSNLKAKKGNVYKIGFEHQTDNVLFRFDSSSPNTKSAYIHYKQFRNQIYFTYSVLF